MSSLLQVATPAVTNVFNGSNIERLGIDLKLPPREPLVAGDASRLAGLGLIFDDDLAGAFPLTTGVVRALFQ